MSGSATDPTLGQIIRFPVERRRPDRLIPMGELCDHFSMSRRFFQGCVAEGMPVHRMGRRALRFSVSEVQEWLEEDWSA